MEEKAAAEKFGATSSAAAPTAPPMPRDGSREGDSPPPLARKASSKKGSSSFFGRMFASAEEEEAAGANAALYYEHMLLSEREKHFDERIRTTCLVIIASAVIIGAMYLLEKIIIPFILAVALKYMLTPIIDLLSWCTCCCGCRLPRPLAVILSFILAICLLIWLGVLIGTSLEIFTERAPLYRERVEEILNAGFAAIEQAQSYVSTSTTNTLDALPGVDVALDEASGAEAHHNLEELRDAALDFLKTVSLTDLILSLLGKAAHVAEDVMYIVLFLVFMLTHHEGTHGGAADEEEDQLGKTVDKQIFTYIRGKTTICAFVAATNGFILWAVGLDLFLAFGVLAFFLNFIPNIGSACLRPASLKPRSQEPDETLPTLGMPSLRGSVLFGAAADAPRRPRPQLLDRSGHPRVHGAVGGRHVCQGRPRACLLYTSPSPRDS